MQWSHLRSFATLQNFLRIFLFFIIFTFIFIVTIEPFIIVVEPQPEPWHRQFLATISGGLFGGTAGAVAGYAIGGVGIAVLGTAFGLGGWVVVGGLSIFGALAGAGAGRTVDYFRNSGSPDSIIQTSQYSLTKLLLAWENPEDFIFDWSSIFLIFLQSIFLSATITFLIFHLFAQIHESR